MTRADDAYERERAEMEDDRRAEVEAALRARVAELESALSATPPPGHVCPVPYGLGPEDLDVLEDLADMVARDDIATEGAGSTKVRAVLDRIIAHHRPPGRDKAS